MKSSGQRKSKRSEKQLSGPRLITDLAMATAKVLYPRSAIPPQINHLLGALQSKSWGTAVRVADSLSKQTYESAADHFAANQLALLVKKVPYKDPSLDPEGLATKKFKQSEHRCKRVNQRFRQYHVLMRTMYGCSRIPNITALVRAQAWIERVIGSEPNYDVIFSKCEFGPGASVGVHGSDTTLPKKLGGSEWTVTPSCAPIARAAVLANPHLRRFIADIADCQTYTASMGKTVDACFAFVSHNKVTMVPKSAMTHRAIAIEPVFNGYVQKGIEEFFKTALGRRGINLRDQKRNQQLAKQGSSNWLEFNPLATIDLSAASDSLAIEVVRFLLPPAWFSLLNSTRSPAYLLGDQPVTRYHKFTSMGNGFCFPLETLIFSALIESVYAETGDTVYSVYGDDIIVRQSAALRLIELLSQCGFKTNTDKTFVFGPFRESCGADYFGGVDVRPYTLDFIPYKSWEIFKIHNEFGRRLEINGTAISETLLKALPPQHRFLRPYDGPPDEAITVPMDVFMGCEFAKFERSTYSWSYKGFRHRPVATRPDRNPFLEMYSALRGFAADRSGRVAYSMRRKTRTRVARYGSPPQNKRRF